MNRTLRRVARQDLEKDGAVPPVSGLFVAGVNPRFDCMVLRELSSRPSGRYRLPCIRHASTAKSSRPSQSPLRIFSLTPCVSRWAWNLPSGVGGSQRAPYRLRASWHGRTAIRA